MIVVGTVTRREDGKLSVSGAVTIHKPSLLTGDFDETLEDNRVEPYLRTVGARIDEPLPKTAGDSIRLYPATP